VSELVTDALNTALRAYTARLDREVHGAWRAGYDYLHVYMAKRTWEPGEFEFPALLIEPAHKNMRRLDLEGYRYLHSYDLRDVETGQLREVLDG